MVVTPHNVVKNKTWRNIIRLRYIIVIRVRRRRRRFSRRQRIKVSLIVRSGDDIINLIRSRIAHRRSRKGKG